MAFSADASSDRLWLGRFVALTRRFLTSHAVRFVLVGGLNTMFGYGLFAALYLLTHMRQTSLVAATVAGVLFNFFTIGRLVFASRGWRFLVPFALGYGVTLLLNMVALEALTRLGVPTLLAQAIAMPAMVVLSYLLNRHVVFRGAPIDQGTRR